jgi:flagellin
MTALRAAHQLNTTQGNLASSLERISSGLRVNRAADDAAGLGVATNLGTKAESLTQAMRNTNDGISIIQTAEGAALEVVNILDRMRELAIQSASETLANGERQYIEDEFLQLNDEIARISGVTEFNGITLADGSLTTLAVQVGIENATTSRISITLGDLTSTTLGTSTLSLVSSTSALAAINSIDTALDTVNAYRSDLGAVQNRLDSSLNNAMTYYESLSAAEGEIMDADFAYETAEMTKYQIMQQAGVAALSQAKNITETVVSLLNT